MFSMKKVSILGSTGSAGTQSLDIVRNLKNVKILGLTANKNIELLKQQINEFSPEAVGVMDKQKAEQLQERVEIPVYSGMDGLIKIATLDGIDTVLNSVAGSVGLVPTIEAIKKKKKILLANKETLVVGGELVMKEIQKNNVDMIPIDSEHSAIFQCLMSGKHEEINKIILTASGGPFRNYSREELEKVTVSQALNHPNWKMGKKITIDSATLMNKGFEVIEAHWLFDIPFDRIDVVVHPQSTIHSMIEFVDGNMIAQLGVTDMRIPIQYALTYPERSFNTLPKLDLTRKSLTFEKPNTDSFHCLEYAYDAGKVGGTMCSVLNAADEVGVEAFLSGKIKFLQIPELIKKMMKSHKVIKNPSLEQILRVDKQIRQESQKLIESWLL